MIPVPLINLTASIENISMARLPHEDVSTSHKASLDSETSQYTHESTSVLDERTFRPFALPTGTDGNTLKLCSDMNHAQIKVNTNHKLNFPPRLMVSVINVHLHI